MFKFLRNIAVAMTVIVSLTGFKGVESLFAPSANIWERWSSHDPASAAVIDFSDLDRLLRSYVRPSPGGVNGVAYAAVTPADRKALDAFLGRMANLSISRYNRQQQLAYWINLYNALTLRVVLDHFPVETIRDIDISPGWFSDGPWDKKLFRVEGETVSLNDIEHRILRPIWKDPRVHYAVNCAAIGCPNLQTNAFTGQRVEAMLEAAARGYINDPRGVSIKDGKVTISKIYEWFAEDFGETEENVLAHLRNYAEPALAARLSAIGRIHDTAYDWRLNRSPKG